MDKKKLLMEVLGVFDENEKLTKEVAELNAELTKKQDNCLTDLAIAGRKVLFDRVKSYSLEGDWLFKVKVDGKLLTCFEWLDTLTWEAFSVSYCKELANHSLKEVIGYFMEELEDVYKAKLDKIEKEIKGDE